MDIIPQERDMMILYEKPLRIELENSTLFVEGKPHPRAVRKSADLSKALMGGALDEDRDVYYMFRNIYSSEGIRFDITVIPPGELGEEYPKTFGHHHPETGSGMSYPEAYQVLKGKAVFILQKNTSDSRVEVIMVDAKEGDVMLIPPGYGHVSINNGEETLVLSNLVYDDFSSTYEEHAENRGAAYYYLKDGEIKQNSNYIVKANERLSAKELNSRFGFECEDLLSEFHRDPHRFAFLEKPGILFK
jgi:glucose-6-phosphate isomerase